MKRWKKITAGIVVIVLLFVLWRVLAPGDDDEARYVFTEVLRTDLHATVSSTGTLSAVETVEIGTQVSGQVKAVLVDYNDRVVAGQQLALIDTEALDAALEDARARVVQAEAQKAQAEAQVVEARAQLADAQATLARNQPLADQGYLSQSEIQPLQTAVQTAEATLNRTLASLKSAEAQVAQAEAQVAQRLKDRRNAEIRAPIDGIIVERSVDAGQTVAASFNTPTLFLLARNLEQMQILAAVDESDIGQISKGQAVTFTVPAYPDERYDGVVREVRLQSELVQNVVTYTVVIDAANPDGKLLPGMTATVDFVTGSVNDALAVSTAALQLQPTPEMQAVLAQNSAPGAGGIPGPPRGEFRTASQQDSLRGSMPQNARMAMLWYLDEDQELHAVPVQTGLSTGALTEIRPVGPAADVVKPGFRVIEQVITNSQSAFQGGPRGPMGGPPPR